MRLGQRIGQALLAALATAGCSPLRTFDALVPKDGGTMRIAADLPYGADPRQRLDVYAPRRPGASPLATIVFFYGGSWSSGTRRGYGFAARALASRGFVVVVPDYRLVPAVRFPAFLADCAASVRWARANVARYGGDRARIVLVGHSAGAYNAAMLALDPQWLGDARGAVRGFVGLAGPYDFLPLEGPITTATFGAWPVPEETQPIRFAGAGDPPALLLSGAEDRTVLPRNGRALGHVLQAAGVPVEVREYPRLGHVGMVTALARPLRGKAPVLADIAAFAHRVTQGAPASSRPPAARP